MGATPIAIATAMNSRIGKYSASMVLVPTSRLELLRLFRPPAPQAGVSTNFTTWAYQSPSYPPEFYLQRLLRNRLVLACFLARLDRRGLGRFRRRFRRLGFLLLLLSDRVHHSAARRRAAIRRREIGEQQAEEEKHGGENRGGAREEIGRAGGAEQAA